MAKNMGLMLANDLHLKPLLHIMLGEIDPKYAQKNKMIQEDWEYQEDLEYQEAWEYQEDLECIECPDGSVTGFRLDVVAGGRAGGINIRDGYIRALAHSLKQGLRPPSIKVVSIINHNQIHWTSSVAEIKVNPDFYESLEAALMGEDVKGMSIQAIVNQLNKALHPELASLDDDAAGHKIDADMRLFGTKKVSIKHYDSHNANPKESIGGYYPTYKKSVDALLNANKEIDITIEPAPCKQQKGNTCGDNSLWNGFMGGVLGLSPEEEYVQMESEALRAFAEHNLENLRENALDGDADVATEVRLRVQDNIKLAKQMSPPPSPILQRYAHEHTHDHTRTPSTKDPVVKAPVTKSSSTSTTSAKALVAKVTPVTKATSSKELKKSWLPSKKQPAPIQEKEKPRKQVHFQTLSTDIIMYQPIAKVHQQAFDNLFSKYGKGKDIIKNGIKAEYENSVTERYAHGILQRINATIGSVFTKKRNQQMDQLATVIDKLQQDRVLNNNEKGIVLRGILYDIMDDIRLNESKNAFKSRMLELCQKMNLDLDKMSIAQVEKDLSKKLCKAYLKGGFEEFREVAQDKPKPSNKKRNQ